MPLKLLGMNSVKAICTQAFRSMQSHNVNTSMVTKGSPVQKSQQYGNPESFSWRRKKKKRGIVCL